MGGVEVGVGGEGVDLIAVCLGLRQVEVLYSREAAVEDAHHRVFQAYRQLIGPTLKHESHGQGARHTSDVLHTLANVACPRGNIGIFLSQSDGLSQAKFNEQATSSLQHSIF